MTLREKLAKLIVGETAPNPIEEPVSTDLENLCGDDKETYQALQSMFSDPRKIEISMEDAVGKAREYEKKKDNVVAAMWYEVAGGLAIYQGNVKKVIEYYGKSHELSGREYSIRNCPEKAIAMAKEYYEKFLKENPVEKKS